MFVGIRANGVKRYVDKNKLESVTSLKTASDYTVDVDDNGDIVLYSGEEVDTLLHPKKTVKEDIAATLGVKKTTTTKKTTTRK